MRNEHKFGFTLIIVVALILLVLARRYYKGAELEESNIELIDSVKVLKSVNDDLVEEAEELNVKISSSSSIYYDTLRTIKWNVKHKTTYDTIQVYDTIPFYDTIFIEVKVKERVKDLFHKDTL